AFDPEYTGYSCSDVTGSDPPCVVPPVLEVASADADATYNYLARLNQNPPLVQRLQAIANTGAIQHPMITVHGDQDSLLPIKTDSDLYSQMVQAAHRGQRYRFYTIRGGNHVDSQFDDHNGVDSYGNTLLRPIQPCARVAFDALVAWVEQGTPPPPSHTIARPPTATADQLANDCSVTS